jgi:hypothetical protein
MGCDRIVSDASEELAAEMAAVVADLHPLGFGLIAKAVADTDTSILLETIKADVAAMGRG